MTLAVGVDVGGTKLLAALVDEEGRVLAERRGASPPGTDAMLDAVVGAVAEVGGGASVAGVGVGVAGMVDRDGTVVFAPNLPGLRGAPLRDALAARVDVAVAVDNDANVAALAEARHGAAAGVADVLVVTLGTGIGGGLILGGRLHRGAHGFAGEIGHFTVEPDGPRCACGARGHWEAVASGTALDRRAAELVAGGGGAALVAAAGGDRSAVTGVHVGTAARAGDAEARSLLADLADRVALGLAGLANILDPEVVVVGGGLVTLGELLLDPVRERFAAHLEAAGLRPPVEIRAAECGEHAGAVGAAALVREGG